MRLLPHCLRGVLGLAIVSSAAAIEPWADPKLPVRDGLAVWLDASRLEAARAALNLPVGDTVKIALWPDGSGQARHARQDLRPRQPDLEVSAAGTTVRFDGQASFLAGNGVDRVEAATLFVVAAPRSNAGNYRALAAFRSAEENDFTSGLNVDFGPARRDRFDTLNIEGAGARGRQNLLTTRPEFGTYRVFAVLAGPAEIQLHVDGKPQGTRARSPGTLSLARYFVGARSFANDGGPPRPQGFLDGNIAEVLVYDRALSAEDRARVEQYLSEKHQKLRAVKLPPSPAFAEAQPLAGTKPLVPVVNRALVQWHAPGFEAREAPLKLPKVALQETTATVMGNRAKAPGSDSLPNINFIRYRHDGVLVAGGYNGKIWLLRDTDGDGIEDDATLYYESPTIQGVMGLALTPRGDPRGDGVFVATMGHVLFIPDRDGDGKGDREIVAASGWEPPQYAAGGVSDCLGLALDAEGNVWFGLGTADFRNGYLVDKATGTAGYRLNSERGTIQRLSADFKSRTTVSTGIRFPVGMAFNARGDLFATDQEGATWLPNGNPFDELLHIQAGRHYGFPPRHPKHLPDVRDEPSVFDFEPQHQSTCGLFFNERSDGGPIFGPAWWQGDAFVVGASRGKIWRIKLAPTAAGYVAQAQLVATLAMLPIDATLSPRGDLVVTCHSGAPDWGSGPNGPGKIFHLRTAQSAPQPVAAWAASPTEVRVAFDRPLDAGVMRNLAARIDGTSGRYVFSADRYETVRPGYQVVRDQRAAPRFAAPIVGTNLSADARTLIVRTAARTEVENLALTIPTSADPAATPVDVLSTLHGVTAEWRAATGATWSGWLPHPNLAVARHFTAASAEHDALWPRLNERGRLTLRGQFDLWQMLQPAVQPGSKLGHAYAPEKITVVFAGSAPFRLNAAEKALVSIARNGRHEAETTFAPHEEDAWLPFEIIAEGAALDIAAHWYAADDPRPRAFPVRRVLLPWAKPPRAVPSASELEAGSAARDIAELRGGNWMRGKALFAGKATCILCHTMNDASSKLGPDLANLAHRDYDSVLKDIREPNAAINPDHIAYMVELTDGTSFAGVVNGEKDGIVRFTEITGPREVARAKIKSQKALPVSLMPPGLLESLSTEEQRDLLTYLLQPSLAPAPLMVRDAPPPRKRAVVEAVLKQAHGAIASTTAPTSAAPLRILLCASEKDAAHGRPGAHDYPLWRDRWSRLLSFAEGVSVDTSNRWPTAEQWASNDLVVFNSYNPAWALEKDAAKTAALGRDLDAFLARGGGLVFIHFSLNASSHATALAQRVGLAWQGGVGKFRHGASDWVLAKDHPLAAGFTEFRLPDESYWNMSGDLAASGARVLATSAEQGTPQPQMWTREVGPGRVFVSVPGHYTWTFDDPLYRILIFRGMMWSVRQPMDRLAPLAMLGARVED